MSSMDTGIVLRIGKRHRLILATKRTAWSMAELFGLRRLHDYLLNSSTLSAQPVWLLGVCFQNSYLRVEDELEEKVLMELLSRFKSLMYSSYRYDFSHEGLGDWTSDIGWGCTIRCGQMMMAQALFDHLKVAEKRKASNGCLHNADIASVMTLFWDSSGLDHLYSLHRICRAAANYGVAPGSWMGPGFVCRLLSEITNAHCPLRLRAELISHPDGAPYLTPSKIDELMDLLQEDDPVVSDEQTEKLKDNDHAAESTSNDQQQSQRKRPPGLVLFIPLVLGVSKIDDRYLKQLKQILTWKQSVGFIGGRSNSSLYFVGFQEDNLIYLDPHKPQAATDKPQDLTTYFNSPLRHMHVSSLITSLSIGFYCKSQGELQDLMHKLSELQQNSEGAPIVSFIEDGVVGGPVDLSGTDSASEVDLAEAKSEATDEWEIL